MEVGKKFEELIQDSCKIAGVDCTRLKDAGYQGETTERRFTSKNLCDFIMFDGSKMLYIEAKTSEGKRIDFKRLSQQKDLFKKYNDNQTVNVFYGYLLEFRKVGLCFYVSTATVDRMQKTLNKKSFNVDDLEAYTGVGAIRRVNTYIPNRKRNSRLDMGFIDHM